MEKTREGRRKKISNFLRNYSICVTRGDRYYMTGEELRDIRLMLGLTQEKMGKILGFSHPNQRISDN